jgi:hypothetical protein
MCEKLQAALAHVDMSHMGWYLPAIRNKLAYTLYSHDAYACSMHVGKRVLVSVFLKTLVSLKTHAIDM